MNLLPKEKSKNYGGLKRLIRYTVMPYPLKELVLKNTVKI
jgi:hypothetical protein